MDYLSVVRPFTGDITEQQFVVSWDSWSRRSFPGFPRIASDMAPTFPNRNAGRSISIESGSLYFLGIVFVHLIGSSVLLSKNTIRGTFPRRHFFEGSRTRCVKKLTKTSRTFLRALAFFTSSKKNWLVGAHCETVHPPFGFMQIQCKERTMRGLSRHVNALQCFQCIQYTNATSGQVLQTTTSFE